MSSKRVNRDTIQIQPRDSFYTPAMRKWLSGYQPVLATEMMRGYVPVDRSKQVSQRRTEARAAGEEWATGTITGMGKNN
jgi:hypothetical protein